MTHLSPAELVDAIDDALTPSRTEHLERCAGCCARVAELRLTFDAARGAEVPEPSPLYWPHMAARIRERIAGEAIVPAWRARPWRDVFTLHALAPIASAAALVAAVCAGGLMVRGVSSPVPSVPSVVAGGAPADLMAEPDDSDVWQVLTSAAADVPVEDAHAAGMAVPSGAVDRAMQRLTPAELTELGRLLQSELRGPVD
jgi:hypothetical protein